MNDITAHDAPDQLVIVDGEGMSIDEFSQRVSERLAQFAEPPHVTESRAQIRAIRARADARRAEIRPRSNLFDRLMVCVTGMFTLWIFMRVAWAWHLGHFPG